MKKQRSIKKRLEKELSARCYQIGIPCIEEPKVCWNREQFKWYLGSKRNNKNNLGRANYKHNAILIDLDHHKFYQKRFTEIRDTLIHELVHMRWQKQKHGTSFRDLIQRIKKGEKFPIRTSKDMWEFQHLY